jgi:hypothetical protein
LFNSGKTAEIARVHNKSEIARLHNTAEIARVSQYS